MYPPAPPPPPFSEPARFPRAAIAVIPPLTLAAAVVGLLPTSRPIWSPSSSWVLAGSLFAQCTRRERYAAALGTGVVTVPLLGLSFALLDSSGLSLAGVLGALYLSAALGAAPLVGGVAVAGAIGRPRQLPAAAS